MMDDFGMVKLWFTHPWRMRRWFANPKSMWSVFQHERECARYRRRTGYGYYDPPPDHWPQPIPDGWGTVYRCLQQECYGLFCIGSDVDGSCPECGCRSGTGVGHYGTLPVMWGVGG